MGKVINQYIKILNALNGNSWLPLLAIRLILATGFYGPARNKWVNFDDVVQWFTYLGVPFPETTTVLVAAAEAAGVVSLVLGFGTRLMSLPLMIIMVEALRYTQFQHLKGFHDPEIQVPVSYFVMLLVLFFSGPGKYSLDYLIGRNVGKTT